MIGSTKCVGLGVVLVAKLVSVSEMTQMTFFGLQLKLGWYFCEAETPSQNFWIGHWTIYKASMQI